MSVDRQLSKEDVVHIRNGVLLGHKKERNLAICDKTNEPDSVMLSEMSQAEKDKCHMISLICGI